jgi:hypothetical protein
LYAFSTTQNYKFEIDLEEWESELENNDILKPLLLHFSEIFEAIYGIEFRGGIWE